MTQRSPWQRTHTCGDLTIQNVGTEVVLNGWIENHRDHGQLVFVDLRDRYGVTQIVAHVETNDMAEGTVELLRRLGAEDVVSVRGKVRARDADKINRSRSTGEIELLVTEVTVLSESDTPPFEVLDDGAVVVGETIVMAPEGPMTVTYEDAGRCHRALPRLQTIRWPHCCVGSRSSTSARAAPFARARGCSCTWA